MPSLIIDQKEVSFEPGEDLITVALRENIFVPHYCYHKELSRAATCRMCMVEVQDAGNGKPMPKLATSCSTPAVANMNILTNSERVQEARKAVMEFLLVNHPLDCPVCDQSGECSLQDFSFQYGTGQSIVNHSKRVYGQRKIGSFLELERNRCIHCTRCVRFTQEITATHDLGTFGRGHQLTVDTFVDRPLSGPFQGNLADICPVGAITTLDFRFKKRVWHLQKTPSICDGCASGCNINVYTDNDQIYRIKPRNNEQVNIDWMCDHGRIGFHKYQDNRLSGAKQNDQPLNLEETKLALIRFFRELYKNSQHVIWLESGHSTNEEIDVSFGFLQQYFPKAQILYPQQKLGEIPLATDSYPQRMEKFISPAKSPNIYSLTKSHAKTITLAEWKKIVHEQTIVISNGIFTADWLEVTAKQWLAFTPLELPVLKNRLQVPTAIAYEKAGHFTNRQGLTQEISVAVQPPKNVWYMINLCRYLAKNLESFTIASSTMESV